MRICLLLWRGARERGCDSNRDIRLLSKAAECLQDTKDKEHALLIVTLIIILGIILDSKLTIIEVMIISQHKDDSGMQQLLK